MAFLNPWLLFALPLVFLPILIYFLIRRRKTELSFAAYEWILRAVKRRRKPLRWQRVLRLIAKTLLTLALLFFFARPVFHSISSRRVLVVVDTTMSMAAKDPVGRTRLESAVDIVKGLSSFFSSSELFFGAYDGSFRLLTQRGAAGGVPAVEALTPTGQDGTLAELIEQALPVAEAQSCDTLCVVSDFQEDAVPDVESLCLLLNKKEGVQFVFLPVDRLKQPENLSVDSVEVSEEGFFPGRKNYLLARLSNHADQPADALPVQWFVNGKVAGRCLATVGANADAVVPIPLLLPADEESLVEIRIPDDALAGDNRLAFVAQPRSTVNLLGVSPTPVNGAFKADFFFQQALASAGDGSGVFRYHSVTPEQLHALSISSYDALFLFGVDLSQSNQTAQEVHAFLAEGKSVVSFSDPTVHEGWKGIGVNVTSTPATGSFVPDPERVAGTLLSFFADGKMEPEKYPFQRVGALSFPSSAPTNMQTLLTLKGLSSPVGVAFPWGGGNLSLFGFVPETSMTTSVLNGNFVRFVLRLISKTVPGGTFSWVRGGDPIWVPQDETRVFSPGEQITLVDAESDSSDFMEVRTACSLERDTQSLRWFIRRPQIPMESGFLTIQRGAQTLGRLGVNATRGDSDLRGAKEVFFQAAERYGVNVQRHDALRSNRSDRENQFLALVCLILAICFDLYAHFGRRG